MKNFDFDEEECLVSLLLKTIEAILVEGHKGKIIVSTEDGHPAGLVLFSEKRIQSWEDFIYVLKQNIENKDQNQNTANKVLKLL